MKKALLCLFFALGIGGLSAQSIDVTSPAGCFAATFTFNLDVGNSPDVNGRNVYFYSNSSLEIRFNNGASRWEIKARGGNDDVYYINTFTSSPNPPDSGTSPWDDFGFCESTGNPTVSGNGTQSTIGGDPCDGLGGDTDGDGACDDNDTCPGFDDFADMDSDGIPDGCDANPTVPDGVLVDATCLNPDPILFTLSGQDGTGRNIYSTPFANGLEVRYNDGLSRWEVRAAGGNMDVYFFNSFSTFPDPPNTTTGTWEPGPSQLCTGAPEPDVSGSGTMDCVAPVITSVVADQPNYCPLDLVTLTITGDLNGAEEWVIYGNQGCGVNDITRVTDDDNDGVVVVPVGGLTNLGSFTFYVRGEGGCVANSESCTSVEVEIGGTPADVPALGLDQSSYCPNVENIELTITGNLNNADEWVIYNNDGCGVTEVGRVTDDDEDGVVVVNLGAITQFGPYTIYVRGEGACVADPGACAEIVANIGGTPADVPALGLNQSSYCPNTENIELTITGDLNDADEWVIYNNDGCGVTEVGRVTDDDEDGVVVVNLGAITQFGPYTIYVRGEGACVADPGDCAEIVANIGGTPADVPLLGLDQSSYCPNVENIELTITGNLNDADEWVIYNNDGCGVTEVGRVTDDDEDGVVVVNLGAITQFGPYTIYVRGEGACVADPGACAEIVANIGGTPADIPFLGLDQSSYCSNTENIQLTITGDLNDADEWVIYNNDGCGVTEVGRVTDDDEDGIVVVNIGASTQLGPISLFVRGEGACVADPGACVEIIANIVDSDLSISCTTVGTVSVESTCLYTVPDYTGEPFVTVTGRCGGDFEITQYPSPGTLLVPGVYPIRMTAVNEAGASDACTITLTVQDGVAPSATSPLPTINVDCVDEVPDPDPEQVMDEADNCGDCPETVWVNEFHYDNAGVDVNEFVEVAGTAGIDLSSYSLYFYDGATGTVYMTSPLTGTIDDESNGFGAITFPIAGIQDEIPDGFALVKDGTQVLEFWSYDGIFVATDGPATGMQSTDVGFTEMVSAEGNSLQLNGTGNIGPDFTWTGPTTASPGDLNAGQTLEACGGVIVTHFGDTNNGGSGDNGDPYIVTRTYQVTDGAGNVILVTQQIRAEDTEAPTFTCNLPPNSSLFYEDECTFPIGSFIAAFVTDVSDNCTASPTITQDPTPGTLIDLPPGGTFQLTFTVTDEAGNADNSCTGTVTMYDTSAPVFDNCPRDQTPVASGCFYELPDYITTLGITATDNCTAAGEITLVQSPAPGTMISTTTEVTITATDAAGGLSLTGLSTSCTFLVNFEGGDPPTITCPTAITVDNDAGYCGAVVTVPAPTVSDGCGATVVVNDYNAGGADASGFYPVGITPVTFTVTDEKEATDECSVNITVNDVEDPTAICTSAVVEVQLDSDGLGSLTALDIDDGSTDNCAIVAYELFPNSLDCTDVGEVLVTLTVTDRPGNSDDCTATVTVLSNISIDDVIVTDESCDGAGDGQIEIQAGGGNSLEYSIDGGDTFQPEPLFTGLVDGTYDIVVRDDKNTDCLQTTSADLAAGPVCELTAADPCNCLNNASPYDMDTDTGGGDGQFSEVVTIAADQPLPAGLVFRVIAPTTGVYDVYNVPAEGTQSAGVPVATDGSVTFTYNNGVYELPFVHNDGEGYTMTVILEVEGVNAIGFQLSNTCFYPEPEITSVLDGPFCSLSLPITLEGNAGGVEGTGTFYIDGTEITVFNPALYEPGTYTISYEFDAGEALGYQIENTIVVGPPDGAESLEAAEADPGCIATVVKSIEVIPTPEGYACREQVNVNLQENCQATLSPESLVGNLECVDLSGYFEINVEDGDESNGATVDGCGNYRYTITGPDGFDCWGFVKAEDKQAPTLDYCPPTIEGITKNYGFQPFICDDITKLLLPAPITYTSDKDGNIYYDDIPLGVKDILDITGYATFVDNCGDLTITVSDDVAYGYDPDCDDVKIIRTFTAVDGCQGLAATAVCTQEIIFTKPDLEDVYCPEDVELACDDEFKLNANGNPHPDETGYPWVYTAFDLTDDEIENYKSYLDQSFCNVGASYTDGARIEVCAGTYKVVRTWEILDWCSKETVTCQQIIKVGDNKRPVVTCPEVDYDNDGETDLLSFSTGPYDCTAAFSVPLPGVTDNCSEWEVLTEIIGFSSDGPVVATILPGQSRFVSGIPVGCHFIRYTVTDGCEQQEVLECPFVVEDRVEPTAVCNDDLNVSIGGQGLARVYADDINEGSSDNCGPIRIEVRRRITLGADYDCLDMFDYDGDGEVIGDEVRLSTQFGDPDGTGNGQQFYYTAWGDFVDFNCCDMDQDVRIELRVWDDRNGDGLPGNEIEKTFCNDKVREIKDNYNVCWMDLLIEDKLPAYCVPPLPASIDCDALPFDFDPTNVDQMNDLFGEATGTDNCPVYTVSELTPMTDGLNDCGYGTLVRRFQVADAKGQVSTNNCEQLITIKERHHYKIKFPKDAEAICGTSQPDTIEVEELACDLLAVSVKEDFFSASGDECYKIFRTYSVINWCEYDGQSDPVVVSRDEDCDGQPGDEDIWVIVDTMDDPDPCYDYYGTEQADYYSHVWYDRDNDPFNLLPKAGTKGKNCDYETNPFGFWKEVSPITENQEKDTDAYPEGYDGNHCDDMASTGYWQYTQIIKVYDNVNPVVSFTASDPFCSYSSDFDNDCPAEVSISFTIDENCTPDDLTINLFLDQFADGTLDGEITNLLSGTYPNYMISGSFPLGAHAIGVSVEDGCGNQVGINIPFEVVDCKAPAPACINGLAIELMPVIPAADVDDDGDIDNGAMAIWASDFIASTLTDCSPEVTYSINRIGEEADRDQTGLTLTCDDGASLLVEIWAWDKVGNGDFCETYVLVQDNMVNCEGNASGSIAGMITDEDLRPMEGVEVALSGSEIQEMVTEEDGHYAFNDLAVGFDYTVTPHLDRRPLNGVSTFDLVLMSKHILGVQLLDSPYKMIAADVNNSKTITTLDAIQLRRLVLNIDTKFGNNNSWRFIPRNYRFPDPAAPWAPAFPEVINVNNLQGQLDQEDFIALKIGDLNLSAATGALEFEARNTVGTFLLEVSDRELRAGETYRVEFRAKDLARIQGYQLTLQVDPEAVSVSELNYGLAKAVNFGMRLVKEGFITTSWNVPVDGSARYSSEEVLFSLDLEATADVQLSDILLVSNRITVAEAYDLNDQLLDVGIDFGTGTVATSGFELYQNVPNPFRESTNIGFYLPEASEVSLRISDVSGRTIKLIRANFDRGQHQLPLTRNELGAAGMLYYTLTAGEHSATRKLIVIE